MINISLTAAELWIDSLTLWQGYELLFVCLYVSDQVLKMFAYGSVWAYWNAPVSGVVRLVRFVQVVVGLRKDTRFSDSIW